MSWVTGDLGASRIIENDKLLKERFVFLASEEKGVDFEFYVPWMSSKKVVNSPRFDRISSPENKFITTPNFLEMLQKIYDDCEEPLLYVPSEGPSKFHIGYDLISAGFSLNDNPMGEAFEIATSENSWLCNIIKNIVENIVPLIPEEFGPNIGSVSSKLAYGAIFTCLPNKKCDCTIAELAITLAHEAGHQALMNYQFASKILNDSYNIMVYSGIRKQARPATMSLHAAVALSYMIEMTRIIQNNPIIGPKDKLKIKEQEDFFIRALKKSISALSTIQFTELGKRIMRDLIESAQ